MAVRREAGTVVGMGPLDRSLVESFLRRRFDPSDVTVLSGGTWSQAFAVSAGGERLVDGHGDAPHQSWSDWLRAAVEGAGEGRIAGWREALAAVPGAMARYETGAERFEAAMAACPEVRLVAHTDLGAGNTLTAGGRISGIIDWGNAVAGDPLYDIAHLTFWAPWHTGCPEALLRRSAAEVLGDANFAERVYAYELHISLDAQRFNAAMGRSHLLDQVAARADYLARK